MLDGRNEKREGFCPCLSLLKRVYREVRIGKIRRETEWTYTSSPVRVASDVSAGSRMQNSNGIPRGSNSLMRPFGTWPAKRQLIRLLDSEVHMGVRGRMGSNRLSLSRLRRSISSRVAVVRARQLWTQRACSVVASCGRVVDGVPFRRSTHRDQLPFRAYSN